MKRSGACDKLLTMEGSNLYSTKVGSHESYWVALGASASSHAVE